MGQNSLLLISVYSYSKHLVKIFLKIALTEIEMLIFEFKYIVHTERPNLKKMKLNRCYSYYINDIEK